MFKILSVESWKDEAGWMMERVCFDINSRDVQVIRYDGNSDSVSVFVDDDLEFMPLSKVGDYVSGLMRSGMDVVRQSGSNGEVVGILEAPQGV